MGDVEKVGSGIRRIREATAAANVPAPKFETTGFFTVTFRKAAGKEFSRETQVGIKSVPSLSQVCLKSVSSLQYLHMFEIARDSASIEEMMKVTGQTNRTRFRATFLRPLLDAGIVAMTEPDKPQSSKQRYVLTQLGKKALEKWQRKKR